MTIFNLSAKLFSKLPRSKEAEIKQYFINTIVATFLVIFAFGSGVAHAALHKYDTGWSDYGSNPAFDPAGRAYYPAPAHDNNKFSGHGAVFYYKMWYSNGSQIGLAYSDDAKTWIDAGLLPTLTNGIGTPPCFTAQPNP